MEVTTLVGRDHPVDLKRVVLSGPGSPGSFEHLVTLVPAQFRAGTVKVCFVGRSDITFLRADARNDRPPPGVERRAARFTNLAMTLKPGDVVRVGPDLMDLKLLSVGRAAARLALTLRSPGLLLNLEPLSGSQQLDLHGLIEKLNHGQEYRSDAL